MTVLLPCPFCGRTDLLGFESTGEAGFLAVKCRACGTHGPAKLSMHEHEAAAHWNNRAAQPPAVDADYKLPCSVRLPLALTIGKGVPLRTLLLALQQRETWPEEDRHFPGEVDVAAMRERLGLTKPGEQA